MDGYFKYFVLLGPEVFELIKVYHAPFSKLARLFLTPITLKDKPELYNSPVCNFCDQARSLSCHFYCQQLITFSEPWSPWHCVFVLFHLQLTIHKYVRSFVESDPVYLSNFLHSYQQAMDKVSIIIHCNVLLIIRSSQILEHACRMSPSTLLTDRFPWNDNKVLIATINWIYLIVQPVTNSETVAWWCLTLDGSQSVMHLCIKILCLTRTKSVV